METVADCRGNRSKGQPAYWTALVQGSKTSMLPLIDQGIVSTGSFLTQFILARACGVNEYGTFALLWGIALVFVNFHGALVTYPLTLAVAQNPTDESRHPVRTSLLWTFILCIPSAVVVPLACAYLHVAASAPFVIAATVSWQLQEVCRRVLLARTQYLQVIPGDLISYLLQAFILFVAGRYTSLSISGTFLLMALTSLTAAAIQFLQMHGWRSDRLSAASASTFWALGKWGGASTALGILQGPAAAWTLAAMWGTRTSAGFQAIANIFGVTHPVLFSLGNVVVPEAAAARVRSGPKGAMRAAWTWGRRFSALMLPYLALVSFAPTAVVRLFYGTNSPYLLFTTAIPLMALNYTVLYVAQIHSAALNGLGRPDVVFRAVAKTTAVTILAIFPLIRGWGLWGAVAVLTIVNTMKCGFNAYSLRRLQNDSDGGTRG